MRRAERGEPEPTAETIGRIPTGRRIQLRAMLDILHSLAVIALHLLSWYGWGAAAAKLLHGGVEGRRIYAVTLGLSLWVAMGGILCLMYVATTGALCVVLVAGLVLAAHTVATELRAGQEVLRSALTVETMVPLCLGAVMLGFLVLVLMPAGEFNIADDFQYCLKRPVRILATGSAAGDPFDCLGMDSMGAQSYLHAYFLIWLPLTHLNVLDAVMCFTLATCLLVELGRWLQAPWLVRVLAVLLFIGLEPQFANLSSLFSGSLMILGLVSAAWLTAQAIALQQRWPSVGGGVAAGLFLGSLIPLKTTLGPYALAFGLGYPFAIVVAAGWRRRPAATLLAFWGVSVLTTLMWMAGRYAQFAALLGTQPAVEGAYRAHLPPLARVVTEAVIYFTSLEPAFYGGWYYQYTLIAVLLLAACAVGTWLLRTGGSEHGLRVAPFTVSSLAGLLGAAGVFLMVDDPASTALRYCAPLLLPSVAACPYICVHEWTGLGQSSRRLHAGPAALLMLSALLLGTCVLPSVSRVGRLWRRHTLLAFDFTRPLADLGRAMMGPLGEERARHLQNQTEPGTGILLHVGAPFHYDYRRNRIYSVIPAGLISPGLGLPVGAPEEVLRRFLIDRGIQYVVHEPYGITNLSELRNYIDRPYETERAVGNAAVYFSDTLASVVGRSVAIDGNDQVTLVDITTTAEGAVP